MPSITQSINSGYRLGKAFNPGPSSQEQSYMAWVRKQMLDKAIGVRRGRNGEMFTPEWMSPEESVLARGNFLKVEQEAYSRSLQDATQMTTIRSKMIDEFKKIFDEDGITPDAKKGLISRIEQSYIQLLGQDAYSQVGVDLQSRFSTMQESKDFVDTIDTLNFNALSLADSAYRSNPNLDNLKTYSTLYNQDRKKFKDLGFTDPQSLENGYKTMERTKIEQERDRSTKQQTADIEKQKQLDIANQRGGSQEMTALITAGENDPNGFPKGTVYKEVKDGSGNIIDADVKYKPPQPENLTQKERDIQNRTTAVPKIQAVIEKKGPMAAYEQGWRVNDDGTLYTELDTGSAVKLPSFNDVAGKRGATKEVLRIGEMWDDAKEIDDLLADPGVQQDMIAIEKSGVWDQIKGKSVNEVRKYLQTKGFATGGKKTMEVISRIQEYASEKRNQLLGAAVTEYEMKSVQPWLLDASDTFDIVLNKVGIARAEGEQALRRWLDIYKDQANMAPIYKAFGIDRFTPDNLSPDADVDRLLKKYGK